MKIETNGYETSHTWTYDEMHDLALADPDTSGFETSWYDENDGNYVVDSIDGWLDYIRKQIEYFGLVFDDEAKTITFHTPAYDPRWSVQHQFEGISAVFNLIDKAYEHNGPLSNNMTGWGPMLPDLGGDDDVDYQSSIPSMLCDFVQHLLTKHYEVTE